MEIGQKGFFTATHITALAAISAVVLLAGIVSSVFIPFSTVSQGKNMVIIEYGSGLGKTSATLKSAGVIRNTGIFRLYSLLGARYRKIKAGEYEFGLDESGADVLAKLVKGDFIMHEAVIPEGSDLNDIGAALKDAGVIDSPDKFIAAARDAKVLKQLGIGRATAEGMLFPETYDFVKGEGMDKILGEMHALFKTRSGLDLDKRYKINGAGYTGYQALIMASLIEKEAKIDRDRPLVASVFYNRLKAGMRLESCATVRYAMDKKRGTITLDDLQYKSPYNTYRHSGLPPGPICSPGQKSIQAALNPARTGYMFFVAKDDGSHTFSADFETHVKAKFHNRKAEE